MRKDVLIARITFAILCLAIVGIIVSVAARVAGSRKDNKPKDEQQEQLQDTEAVVGGTEIQPETEYVEPAEPVVVYVKTTKSVNLRSEANTDSDVVRVLEAGEKLELVSEADGWAEVSGDSDHGFVSMDFLEYVQDDEQTTADPITGSSTVLKTTTDAIRMRSGAGTDFDILMTIDAGVTLEILEETDGWAKVTYQGKTGYVSGDYLQ